MWWGQLHFAQPPKDPPRRQIRSAPSGDQKVQRCVAAELLGDPMSREPLPTGLGVVEDPFMQKQMNNQLAETLGRFRTLSKGFKNDYLGTFAKDDAHLSELQFNHNASARRRGRKEMRKSMSATSFESLQEHTHDIMKRLDPDFVRNHQTYLKEQRRQKVVEELIVQEPGAPVEVRDGGSNARTFYEFLCFVNDRFCTDQEGGWVDGYEACYDMLSFQGHEELCCNEWVTNIKSLRFPATPQDVLQLFRDIADSGVVSRDRFLRLEPVGALAFDALREGVSKARQNQQSRRLGFIPEKPKTFKRRLTEIAANGALFGHLQQAREDAAEQDQFMAIERSKATAALKAKGVPLAEMDNEPAGSDADPKEKARRASVVNRKIHFDHKADGKVSTKVDYEY